MRIFAAGMAVALLLGSAASLAQAGEAPVGAPPLEKLGKDAAKVTPVLISVDPERGTPAVLKDYLANFGPRFVGLTGTREQVLVAARHYRVHIRLYQREDHEGHMRHEVDHGSLIYLVGPDGKFRTLIPFDTPPARMAAVLQKYVGDGAKGSVRTKR